MDIELKKILDFITKAEQLKKELRHSWLSDNRQESVAEHTWRMSLMAIMLGNKLSAKINLEKVLKMVIIHDLVEIEAGDVSALDILKKPEIKEDKQQKEIKAIGNLKAGLNSEIGDEMYDLWYEFEEKKTNESKFANALDKLEVQIQHNHAPMESWEEIEYEMVYTMDKHVSFDKGLSKFKELVVHQAETKMKENGIDFSKFNR